MMAYYSLFKFHGSKQLSYSTTMTVDRYTESFEQERPTHRAHAMSSRHVMLWMSSSIEHGAGARKTKCYGEHHCEATMYFFQATARGTAGKSHKGHKLYITSMVYGIRSPYCTSKGYMLPIMLRGGNQPKD